MGKEQQSGIVGKYKEFNKLTRNIALGITVVAAAVGASALAVVAFGAAMVDQAQIVAIDKFQKWREEKRKQAKEHVVFQSP